MLHPIFSTVVSRPDLVVDHLSAYVALASQEVAETGNDLKVRLISWAVASLFGVLFLVFAGVSAIVGALHGFHWALIAVPGGALAIALVAMLTSRRPSAKERFAELRRQMAADVGLLRTSGDAGHGH